ncbi:hypothetical protein [Bacillus amyloliquefaciens]|nr:hypothetical protein [Bacillus amyloliquefaciens]
MKAKKNGSLNVVFKEKQPSSRKVSKKSRRSLLREIWRTSWV